MSTIYEEIFDWPTNPEGKRLSLFKAFPYSCTQTKNKITIMKRTYLLLLFLFFSSFSFSQAPHTFSYQTVIRDVNWSIIPDQDVSILIRIVENAPCLSCVDNAPAPRTSHDPALLVWSRQF